MKFDPSKAILGSFGSLYLSGAEVQECYGLSAKVSLKKTPVPMCGDLAEHHRVTGWSGKGTIKLNKISSRFARLTAENIRDGKEPVFEIISELKDPNVVGAERVKLKYVKFDELDIANWEAGKLVQESIPFTYEDFEYLDMYDA